MNKNIVSVKENKVTNYETQTMGETIYAYKGKTLVAAYSKTTGGLHTYNLSKAEKRKVTKVIIAVLRESKITKSQAKEFYRDLCGTVYGNSNKNCCGIMPVSLVADHMKISFEKANQFCDAMIKYGITERADGMIII